MSRSNLRKSKHIAKTKRLTLYGKLVYFKATYAYCNLHKCYLTNYQLHYKKCMLKKCTYLKQLDKNRDIIN